MAGPPRAAACLSEGRWLRSQQHVGKSLVMCWGFMSHDQVHSWYRKGEPMKKHNYSIRVFITLVMFVMMVGCSAPIDLRTDVSLEHGPLVPLGGTMMLRAVVRPPFDGPDSEIIFDIPPGLVIVRGQAQQHVSLRADETRAFEIQVRLDQPGEHRVAVQANVRQGTSASSVNYTSFYLEVSDTGTEVRQESINPTPTLEGLN